MNGMRSQQMSLSTVLTIRHLSCQFPLALNVFVIALYSGVWETPAVVNYPKNTGHNCPRVEVFIFPIQSNPKVWESTRCTIKHSDALFMAQSLTYAIQSRHSKFEVLASLCLIWKYTYAYIVNIYMYISHMLYWRHTLNVVWHMSYVTYTHIYKHIHVYHTRLCAYTHTHTHMYMFSEHLLCARHYEWPWYCYNEQNMYCFCCCV